MKDVAAVNYELVQETQLLDRTFSGECCDSGSGDWQGEWRETMIHSMLELNCKNRITFIVGMR